MTLDADRDLPVASGTTQTRDDIISGVVDEAAEAFERGAETPPEEVEKIETELAEKEGDLTLEDLRKLPGNEEFSDEELLAEWKKAQAEATPLQFAHPVYDTEGNKIPDLRNVSIEDLLTGKVQFGYQAMGKEQRKALAEVFRVAQLGHYNESQRAQVLAERNSIAAQFDKAQKQLDQYTKERDTWGAALQAYAHGNPNPLNALAKAYVEALTQPPTAAAEDLETEQREQLAGVQFVYGTVVPYAQDLAARYGADAEQITTEILNRIAAEPQQFLTREKIEAIMQYEIPAVLEQLGYSAGKPSVEVSTTPDDVAELRKQVAALQKTVAESANSRTEALRNKSRRTPPSGGGTTPGAGDSMPSFKDRDGMKKWLRGETDN